MKINFSLIGKPGSGKGTYGKLLSKVLNCPLVVMGDVLRKHVTDGTEIGKLVGNCQNEGRLVDDNIVSRALLEHLKELKNKKRNNNDSQFGFILDGFPRTVVQAKLLLRGARGAEKYTNYTNLVAPLQWPQDLTTAFAVNIEVPDEICIAKMKGRRKCSKCNESFNVTNVNTPDGFFMPPQLPVPYPCNKCDMDTNWTRRVDDTEEIFMKRMKEYHSESAVVKQFFDNQGQLLEFIPYKGIQDIPILEKIVKDEATKNKKLQQ